MPRKPRFILPGQPLHVTIRGVNREPIFYSDVDYRYYLGRLKEAIERHDCALHAYVLMTNHVHLLLTPSTEHGIAKSIQMLGRYYVQYFNEKYGRTGTLWEGRYKSTLVDSEEYLLICHRYIELNPVRANMVDHPAEYPWSSYRCNAIGQPDPLINNHERYKEMGNTDDERRRSYRALFDIYVTDKQLNEIRQAANREWVLGSDRFKAKIEQELQRRVSPLPRGGDRKSISFRNRHQINRN
jgi:putative transposase